ncbi:MAG: GTP-binding protein [Marinifilaceae bacterium]|jgi:G3E family GTPase|nr:GTP-binding protein [Marinifilaceae bacterium]
MNKDNRIPVTILTGFLGVGKTTLLNQLIKDKPKKQFAIIENEFGEIGIDAGLIVSNEENIFELSNGCICCSIHDGFFQTLSQLVNSQHTFNHLLIETTGIADPDSIIQAFLSNELIETKFRLDAVVCLADCQHMDASLLTQNEVRKQIVLADLVLLNKADTVKEERLEELKKLIVQTNPSAQIYSSKFAKVEGIDLLNLKAFASKAIEKFTLSFHNTLIEDESQSPYNFSVLKPVKTPQHKHDIVSFSFAIPGNFEIESFSFWMQNFLYLNKANIFRVKGIISFSELNEKHIFQAVRDRYMYESGEAWGNTRRFNKLVFIGKDIDRARIEQSLFKLLV